jgi:hypothetical protein
MEMGQYLQAAAGWAPGYPSSFAASSGLLQYDKTITVVLLV